MGITGIKKHINKHKRNVGHIRDAVTWGIKEVAKFVSKSIIKGTPFLSGTARTSVRVTKGGPTTEAPEILPKPSKNYQPARRVITNKALSRNRADINKWDGRDKLFISTILDYFTHIEYGTANHKRAHMPFNKAAERASNMLDSSGSIISKVNQMIAARIK